MQPGFRQAAETGRPTVGSPRRTAGAGTRNRPARRRYERPADYRSARRQTIGLRCGGRCAWSRVGSCGRF